MTNERSVGEAGIAQPERAFDLLGRDPPEAARPSFQLLDRFGLESAHTGMIWPLLEACRSPGFA